MIETMTDAMVTESTGFVPTHTIKGVPVIKCKRIPRGTRKDRWPEFRDEQGNVVATHKGAPAVPLHDPKASVTFDLQDGGDGQDIPPAPAAPKAPPVEEPVPVVSRVGETAFVDIEAATAILRCCSWPAWGESCGYAESTGGHCATLEGHFDNGDARVRVCLRGGNQFVIRVPREHGYVIGE